MKSVYANTLMSLLFTCYTGYHTLFGTLIFLLSNTEKEVLQSRFGNSSKWAISDILEFYDVAEVVYKTGGEEKLSAMPTTLFCLLVLN